MARCAIVTGSSSGIGRAVARRLAKDGFSVLLADIRRDPLTGGEPTDELIRRDGGSGEFVPTNVSVRDDCERVVTLAVKRCGSLDVVVPRPVDCEPLWARFHSVTSSPVAG